MSLSIVVGDFSPETTAEELQEVFAGHGVDAEITLNKEGNKDKVTAVIRLPEADRVTADRLAARLNGVEYKGRFLKAYVPLFM